MGINKGVNIVIVVIFILYLYYIYIYIILYYIILYYIYPALSLPTLFFWNEVWCGVISISPFLEKLVNPLVTILYKRA